MASNYIWHHAVQLEEPVSTLKLEPIQELPEEEKGKTVMEKSDCMLSAWMHQSVVSNASLVNIMAETNCPCCCNPPMTFS